MFLSLAFRISSCAHPSTPFPLGPFMLHSPTLETLLLFLSCPRTFDHTLLSSRSAWTRWYTTRLYQPGFFISLATTISFVVGT